MDTEMKNKKNLFGQTSGQEKEKKQPVDENPEKEPGKTDPKKQPEYLLPKDTIITDNRGIVYKVVGYKPSGNFGNIYEINLRIEL